MPDIGGDEIKFQINGEGVVLFGQPAEPPSPTPGGMYYLNGVFYLGENA